MVLTPFTMLPLGTPFPLPLLVAERERGALQEVDRGQLDPSRSGNGLPGDGCDLRAALAALRQGRPLEAAQIPSIGCNIKWQPGAEPAWAR